MRLGSMLPIVLLLDPDAAHRALLRQILLPRFTVREAGTIADAITILMEQHPSLLLLEQDLPDGDSLAFIRRLQSEPAGGYPVVAFVTNRRSVRDKVAGFQAGADDYIVKPVDIHTFLYRVVLLLRLRHAHG
jgi:DNA-binding response OmpR family regulator